MSAEKPTILVVDDDRNLLVALGDGLSFEGFNVVTARSGEQALQKMTRTEPDLIVLDIGMPGMGGLGFLNRISPDGKTPKYPVIVLTARSYMQNFFKNIEVDEFVPKPCPSSQLASKIRAILGEKQKTPAASPSPTPGKNVLLAEDDAEISAPIKRAFEKAGCRVTVVEDGQAVLDKAIDARPHVMVLKELLPNRNGSVLASLLKAMASTRSIPIVVYDDTGALANPSGYLKQLSDKADKVLTTSDPDAVLQAVQAVLGRQ